MVRLVAALVARADHARLGIGLSVAQAYVELLQGKLTANMPTQDTFQITLSLPVENA